MKLWFSLYCFDIGISILYLCSFQASSWVFKAMLNWFYGWVCYSQGQGQGQGQGQRGSASAQWQNLLRSFTFAMWARKYLKYILPLFSFKFYCPNLMRLPITFAWTDHFFSTTHRSSAPQKENHFYTCICQRCLWMVIISCERLYIIVSKFLKLNSFEIHGFF